jgi:hypothetical protein
VARSANAVGTSPMPAIAATTRAAVARRAHVLGDLGDLGADVVRAAVMTGSLSCGQRPGRTVR